MAALTASLVIQSRQALQLTQNDLADLVGCTKRTIQRWETSGATLTVHQVEALVRALHGVDADLAAQVAASDDTTLEKIVSQTSVVDRIVQAAAVAIGTSPEAIVPALAAAFARASEEGLDAKAVADALAARSR